MPGRPVLRKFSAHVEEAGGDHVILDRIAAGDYVTEIAREWGVSRYTLYAWRDDGGEERVEAWNHARELSAEAHVEDAEKILFEDAPPGISSAEVSLRKEQANFKRWLASKRNREEYGDDRQAVNVNVTAGTLHLEALQEHGTLPPEEDEPEQIPAEVVEDGI